MPVSSLNFLGGCWARAGTKLVSDSNKLSVSAKENTVLRFIGLLPLKNKVRGGDKKFRAGIPAAVRPGRDQRNSLELIP
jgi:hypothetical protein